MSGRASAAAAADKKSLHENPSRQAAGSVQGKAKSRIANDHTRFREASTPRKSELTAKADAAMPTEAKTIAIFQASAKPASARISATTMGRRFSASGVRGPGSVG